ncbi:hypothetical protein, partial [Cesiribacter andamanensis]|uniref:hypothetical protein n=1 Tax=Cesiribacter andamanensis TaxID=649507 RepID=UPI00058C0967
ISGQTGTSLSGLAAGRYQLRATRTDLQCSSDPITVEVVDQLPVQTLTLTPTAQSTCAGTPNGSITASYSIAPASSGTVSYRWFLGSSATGTPISSGTSNTLANLAGGQTYTVEATDPLSGCITVSSVTVPLQQAVVIVAATPAPNSICAPASAKNGSISVSQVQLNGTTDSNLANYTFSWYREASGSFSLISGQTASSISGLAAGRYQVRALHNQLQCPSDPFTVEVVDQLPVQTLTLTPTAQTSCSGAPNGSISAAYSISPASSGTVSYRWFSGSTATGTPLSFTGNTATGLAGGQIYTVEATDSQSGCITVSSVFLPREEGVVTLNFDMTPNGICDPAKASAGTTYSGSISVTNTFFNGTDPGNLSGYTFQWFREVSGSFTAISGQTSATLSSLAPGRYQVIATRTDLGCSSAPVTVEVTNTLPVLSLNLTPLDQTSCNGTPNGGITAALSLDGTALTSGYDLEWFSGTGSSLTPLSTGTSSGISNIAGAAYYTVRATHAATGCETVSSVYVPARDGVVTFDQTITPNTVCTPSLTASGTYNGSIQLPTIYFNGADDAANLTNYSFSWWQEVGGSFVAMTGQSGSSLTNLAPGRYQVEVRRTDLNCTTGRITLLVPDQTVNPQLSLQVDNLQRHCVAPYSGAIRASLTIGGAAADLSQYRFEWYRGTSISGTSLGITTDQAGQLASGTYTVRAINTLTGCTAISSIYLGEQLITPATTLAIEDIKGCQTLEKGYLTATVMEGATEADYANYTFRWYTGQAATGAPLAANGRLLDQLDGGEDLPSGYYTVVAFNEVTRCEALPRTGFLRAPVAVSHNFEINRRPSVCTQDNGVATIWVVDENGNPTVDGYTFEWYKDRPIVPNTNFYTDPKAEFDPNTPMYLLPSDTYDTQTNVVGTVYPPSGTADNEGPTAYGLYSGIYTVVITDSEGCKSMVEIAIAYENAPESLVMRLEHVEDCEGSPGGVGVKAIDINGDAFEDQSQYAFFLYSGTNVVDANKINQSPVFGPVGTDGETYFGESTGFPLTPGVYTIIAVDFYGNGCSSTSRTFEIYQIAQPPVVNAGNIVPSSMCEGGNGAATLIINNAEYIPGELDYALTNVSIRWTSWPGSDTGDDTYRPADVSLADGLLLANDPSDPEYREFSRAFTDLAAGTYTLMVEGNTGCEMPFTLVIPAAPEQPIVTATVTDQTYCDPANGAIDITGISGGSANAADYTFYLYRGQTDLASGTALASGSMADMEALQLEDDTYYLVAVQNLATGPGSGCSSNPLELRIRNESVYPAITLVASPNESCDPAEHTGEVEAQVTTATGIFTYNWYLVEANGALTPADNGSVLAGATTETLLLSNLGPGLYRLEVLAENGCPVWSEIQLGDYIQVPVITVVTATPQTSCDDSQAEGTATVSEISWGGTTYTSFADFTFVWRDASGQVIAGANTASISGRTAATYTVEAYKNANPSKGCYSAPYTIVVPYTPIYPTVTLAANPNESCDPLNYTGELQATIN